VGTFL